MVKIVFPQHGVSTLPAPELLAPGELVAVIDDSPDIVLLLSHYLARQGIEIVHGGSATEFKKLLATKNIALALLDIGLPDQDGNEILADIVETHPDLGIIMVTGTTDLQIALECLRHGADDYLIKPVSLIQFSHTIENTLKKRRLAINNRIFQQRLQAANTRLRFLHNLNLKMNAAYLNTVELRGILQAVLVGITSGGGLGFNRAFLALYNEENGYLEGQLAIDPVRLENDGPPVEDISGGGLVLDVILSTIQEMSISEDTEINRRIQSLRVSPDEDDHVLICAGRMKKTVKVENGKALECRVPEGLLRLLEESSFTVVPLYSPGTSQGVIIVDNLVNGKPASINDIQGLEIFASQASLAIEHSHLYTAMAEKISELELVTLELDKSKDLLISAERASAVGHMSAQLLHAIRNPLTSIGGTSRLLVRKTKDPYFSNFLHIITEEASKIEVILEDLLCFVETEHLTFEQHPLYSLIRKTVMIFYGTMKSKDIEYRLDLKQPEPSLVFDETKIRQVFLNLIRNSVEAMDGGGLLHITAEEEEKRVTIHVTDSGPGIPPEALPYVKDPFFTTKRQTIGMGLALVERIISGHGGEFSIGNWPAGGTRATVVLPKN
jgi:signal transduction histidine kinase/FixJ family two-component response regulator